MKIFGIVLKVVAALAAIAGIVYVVVSFGDKIAAWFKRLFGHGCCCSNCECAGCECNDNGECTCECECDDCDCECCDDECECECDECDGECCCENECECCEEHVEEVVEASEKDFEA